MTILSALNKAKNIFNTHNIVDAEQSARILLSAALNQKAQDFLLNPSYELTAAEATQFNEYIDHRIAGMPVAYILGTQPFFGLDFTVTPDVLIPRPETESLVEKVIAYAKANRMQSIVDVGTGSGAIAISLAKNLPAVKVTATDISPKAIELAKHNAAANQVHVDFVEADLLGDLSADLIVANLPYVPTDRIAQLESDVKNFEPHLALDGGPDGLDLYRKLAAQANQLKTKPRAIFCEIDETHGGGFVDLWLGSEVVIEKDLAGLDRYAIVTL